MSSAAGGREAINLETVDFLLSAEGRSAASAWGGKLAQGEDAALRLLTQLRKQYSPAQAGALVALAQLRAKAAAKFPEADRLFFTAEALEQATARPIAEHRAAHLHTHSPPGPWLDLGCGIGGDTLALAQLRPVIAYELDPVRVQLAAANAAALGLESRVEFRQTDWTVELAEGRLPAAAGAFVDPARRADDRRLFHLDQLQPPLQAWLKLRDEVPSLAVKVMPGIDLAEVPTGAGVEFISHAGVCKEALLWFGPPALTPRWASVHTPEQWYTLTDDMQAGAPPRGPLEAGMVLHEPDPAVIRAGAFHTLCRMLDAHLFDSEIAYVVSRQIMTHPVVQSFRVLEVHPFSLQLLQVRVKALDMGSLELKKRGAPFAPESLRSRIKLTAGGRPGVVIFTRRGEERIVILAERLTTRA